MYYGVVHIQFLLYSMVEKVVSLGFPDFSQKWVF